MQDDANLETPLQNISDNETFLQMKLSENAERFLQILGTVRIQSNGH